MITARNVSFTYPGARTAAISDLSFELPKGAFGIIEAAGGEGKSTLIKMLMGIHPPTGGELEVNGFPMTTRTGVADLRRSLGIVSEAVALIGDRTVSENVALPLELARSSPKALQIRLADTLHRFGLDSIRDEFPESISEGERRRTKIARALVSEPFLLLLDDPTIGLDPATSNSLWDLLFREHGRGMTIMAAVSSTPPEPRFDACLRVPLRRG